MTRIKTDGGKYEFVIDDEGGVSVLRYDEPWLSIDEGVSAVQSLVHDAAEMRETLDFYQRVVFERITSFLYLLARGTPNCNGLPWGQVNELIRELGEVGVTYTFTSEPGEQLARDMLQELFTGSKCPSKSQEQS